MTEYPCLVVHPIVHAYPVIIADPPYPPFVGVGGVKNRASRWYGSGQRSKKDRPSDQHPDAAEWDNPERHRQLVADLMRTADGWAIATSPEDQRIFGGRQLTTVVSFAHVA